MLRTGHHLSDDEIRARYEALPHRGSVGPEFRLRVLALAGDLMGMKVLDVGCGKGELLREIGLRYSDVELCGVDFSAARLREACDRIDSRVMLREANIQEGLPFSASFFDRVLCTETLEHLKDPVRCLREIDRVLKRDGRAILTVPNATGFAPFHRLDMLIPGRWLRSKLLPYEHPCNTDQPIDTCLGYQEILDLVRTGGFEIEAIEGYRYFRYLQMLPLVRDVYRVINPMVEQIMPRIRGVRFAYNLLLRCCKA